MPSGRPLRPVFKGTVDLPLLGTHGDEWELRRLSVWMGPSPISQCGQGGATPGRRPGPVLVCDTPQPPPPPPGFER